MEAQAPSREERVASLLERDGDHCQHPECGKQFKIGDDITIDHWLPLSAGGGWELSNLKLMHRRCNQLKGDMLPNDDGTLPERRSSTFRRRAEKRAGREEICDTCMSGRILLIGEECDDCGSGPQPAMAPKSMQMKPKDCDHSTFHCWMCYLGFVERTASIVTVLDGEYLD